MEEVIVCDYTAIALMNTVAGSIQILGGTLYEGQDISVCLDYAGGYVNFLRRVVSSEFLAKAIRMLSLKNIMEQLNSSETYLCAFPCTIPGEHTERMLQWRFRKLSSHKDYISVTLVDTTKFRNESYCTLTGMLNRRGFCSSVRKTLDENPNRHYRIMRIEFDNFKLLNDENGYSGGNRFLRQFAADLDSKDTRFGAESILGHFEADHFLSFRPTDSTSPEDIYAEISEQLKSYQDAQRLTLRMGVYNITDPNEEVEFMCDGALLALKSVKDSFSEYIAYYSPHLADKMRDRQILTSEMKSALEREQFELWFQPQVNHDAGGCLIGAEVLVRWRHPTRGIISPAVFIPLFERNGFIYELDKYIWKRACMCLRRWIDEGRDPRPLSINISRIDFLRPDFFDTITSYVNRFDIPLNLLHLEVTESSFTEDTGTVTRTVQSLIDYGFTVAIDDFGSGYSSLSMLKSVPAQVLKLDMSFFNNFNNNADKVRNECILESVVHMAKMLGMAVLAEGVEQTEQAEMLSLVGCNYIQGYLYSKPLPEDEFLAYANQIGYGLSVTSEIKPSEEMLRENKTDMEMYRSIISETSNIIIVADRHTREVLYANRSAEQFYGKSYDPLNPLKCSEFCNSSDNCKNCPADMLLYKRSTETELNEFGRRLHARYSRIEWNGHDAYVVYKTDNTVNMDAQERADLLIRNIPSALSIFSVNESGAYRIYISNAAKEILDLNDANNEIVPLEKSHGHIYHEDLEYVREAERRCVKTKSPVSVQFRIVCQDGSTSWIEVNTTPLKRDTGEYLYYSIYTDITAEKQIEAVQEEHRQRRLSIYQQMINDEANSQTEKLMLRMHLDLTSHTILESWCDENECSPDEISDADGVDVIQKFYERIIGDEDRERIRREFDKEKAIRLLEEQGYIKSYAEYMRETRSGRICLARSERKLFVDPDNGHYICYIMTYDIGSAKLPNRMLQELISSELENIGLYNMKTGISQIWEIDKELGSYGHLVTDYEKACIEYSGFIIPEERERFLRTISIASVTDNLLKHRSTYRFSFWTRENGERARKTWQYYYLDADNSILLMARYNSTETFVNEQASESKLEEAMDIAERLRYDSTTGVLTRNILLDEIETYFNSKREVECTLLMVDVDNLKLINDTYGHPAGDRALSLMAELLKEFFENGDVIGRVGGDEFVVFLKDTPDENLIRTKLNALIEKANTLMINDDRYLQCSIGYVKCNERNRNFEWMYRRADRALYDAKKRGKNCFCRYYPLNDENET